jgi:hypothetical protein
MNVNLSCICGLCENNSFHTPPRHTKVERIKYALLPAATEILGAKLPVQRLGLTAFLPLQAPASQASI